MVFLSDSIKTVVRQVKDGWELKAEAYEVGHTRICNKVRLQRPSMGRGSLMLEQEVKMVTLNAMERAGLIKRKDLQGPAVKNQPVCFELTKKAIEMEI